MKRSVFFWISAGMYFVFALLDLLFLIWWPDYASRPLSAGIIIAAVFLASVCAFLGFVVLKTRSGSLLWIRVLAISGGLLTGIGALGASLEGGLAFAVPLAIAAFALWRNGMLANNAFESGRAEEPRAPHRER